MSLEHDLNNLQEQLEEQFDWPTVYMFKFLAPIEQLEDVKELFPKSEATTKVSRKGNYISVTFTPLMYDSSHVIDKYREVDELEGVIAL